MADLLWEMWYSPVMFIAVLLILAVGFMLGLTALVWVLEKLRKLKARRAFKRQQKEMAAGYERLRGELQDQMFGNLRAEDMKFDIPGDRQS